MDKSKEPNRKSQNPSNIEESKSSIADIPSMQATGQLSLSTRPVQESKGMFNFEGFFEKIKSLPSALQERKLKSYENRVFSSTHERMTEYKKLLQ